VVAVMAHDELKVDCYDLKGNDSDGGKCVID
jgi:hypothetical protein